MAGTRRFILFELNEVPLRVVRHFAGRKPGSSFAKVLARGRHWTTVTPDEGHLSPWITWPTLHRGVSSADHRIAALGQDVRAADRKFPPVWNVLANAGRRVGMFGSLHSYPPPDDLGPYDFYVPDTFAAGPEAKPAELAAFQQFNLHMVDRSGRNVSGELPVRQALPFLLRSLPAGIRPGTMAKIARQVASERIWRHRTARRRTILVFYNPGNNQPIERTTVSRYDLGDLFKSAWDPDKQPDQWKAVADIVAARDPANIAINTSDMFAFADGMTLSQYKEMMAALPEKYDLGDAYERVRTAENRSLDQMAIYGPAAKQLLTSEQVRKLPPFIALFLDNRAIRQVRPGRAGGGRGGFFGG